jgi:hypothetical protein
MAREKEGRQADREARKNSWYTPFWSSPRIDLKPPPPTLGVQLLPLSRRSERRATGIYLNVSDLNRCHPIFPFLGLVIVIQSANHIK